MEAAVLETIYTGSDAEFQRVADRVDARVKRSADSAEKSLKAQQRAAERLQREQAQSLEALLGRLPGGSRVAQFKGIADEIKAVSAAAKGGEGAVGGLSGVVTGLGGAAAVAAAGVGALAVGLVAVGGFVLKSVKDFTDYAGAVKDLGQESGLAAPTISTVGAYARLAGADVRTAVSALEVYGRNLSEVAHGNKSLGREFERVGISARQAAELMKDPDRAARDLFDRLAKIGNANERLDAANKLASRSGKVLANIALEMGGNFAEAERAAREWGIVLSEADVQAADKFGDAWEVLKMRAEGVIFDIAKGALPELQKSIDATGASLRNSHEDWQEFGRNAGTILRGLIALARQFAEEMAGGGIQEMGRRMGDRLLGNGSLRQDLKDEDARLASKNVVTGTGRGESGIGDVRGRGGQSAAKRAAQLALESARIDLREAESVYREWVDIAKRALDLNLNGFEVYNQRRAELEEERFRAEQGVFAKERAALGRLTGQEGENKLKDLNQREQAALREHNDRKAQITTDGLLHDLDLKKKFYEAGARLMEERQRVADSDLARLVAEGTKTNEQAVRERFTALAKVAEQEGEALRVSLVKALGGEKAAEGLSESIGDLIANAVNAEDSAGLAGLYKGILDKAANKEAARDALDAVVEFFLKRKQAFQQNNKDTREAQAEDLRNWLSYADGLASIVQSVQDVGFEIAQMQADALGENPLNRSAAIEARRALDAARENARSAREIARLEAEVQRVAREEQNHTRAVETISAINGKIEAEERQHQARMVEIDRQANEERRRQLVEIGSDIAGILTAGLEQFDGTWSSIWQGMLQEALGVLRQIGAEILRMAFTGQGSSSGGIVGFLVNTIGGALLGGLAGSFTSGAGSSAASGASGGGASGLGGVGGGVARWFGGGRAKGGPVSAGTLYRVNEVEDEFFRPDVGGEVIPLSKMKGGAGGATVIDNRKYTTINMPPQRAAGTYRSRRGARETAEDLLAFLR